MPTGKDRVIDIISAIFSRKDVGALAINWRNFGSNGHIKTSPGFVLDRFTKSASDNFLRNYYIKSIYRPQAVINIFPHRATLKENFRYVDTLGNDVVFATAKDHQITPLKIGLTSGMTYKICNERIRVNHYAIKSREEFITKKKQRGDTMLGPSHIKKDHYYTEFDRNEIYTPVPRDHYENFRTSHKRLLSILGMG